MALSSRPRWREHRPWPRHCRSSIHCSTRYQRRRNPCCSSTLCRHRYSSARLPWRHQRLFGRHRYCLVSTLSFVPKPFSRVTIHIAALVGVAVRESCGRRRAFVNARWISEGISERRRRKNNERQLCGPHGDKCVPRGRNQHKMMILRSV